MENMIKGKIVLVICFSFVLSAIWGQEKTASSIYSVKMGVPGTNYSVPIFTLGDPNGLVLSFDELTEDAKYLRYKLQHCDQNWNPTDLREFEYLEGINDQLINDYSFSNQTHVNYVHYEVQFPNRSLRPKMSGNYLITVFDEDTDEVLIIRKFMVVDKNVFARAQLKRPTRVSEMRTHQALDFEVNFKEFPLSNPLQDIRVTILQNGIWEKGVYGIPPRNVFNNTIEFDWRANAIFPGSMDFRPLDLRSLDYRSYGIDEITEYNDGYVVTKEVEESRAGKTYFFERDQNGDFIIQNQNTFSQNPETRSEYVEVDFKLKTMDVPGGDDVYVVGAFNNFKPDPRFRLKWNSEAGMYTGTVMMKQGRYDYLYATSSDGETLNFDSLEGNSNETENYYLILTYYRPFGARYDALISADIVTFQE
ncbi:DUF5103 domain-containing protein [Membranihabitans maritimus]|uniref:type IX secretion system plug protein n=1 Tax=Membranihabitans maritimus TaxID=2904244 RepID=UPI001F23B3E0|nr:DUF5103 domain-containing protein [Membranihabitans maritimus]